MWKRIGSSASCWRRCTEKTIKFYSMQMVTPTKERWKMAKEMVLANSWPKREHSSRAILLMENSLEDVRSSPKMVPGLLAKPKMDGFKVLLLQSMEASFKEVSILKPFPVQTVKKYIQTETNISEWSLASKQMAMASWNSAMAIPLRVYSQETTFREKDLPP